ncbi:hypothetical protein LEMLEM_LOCUS16799 [Lemmus lemmus]
MSYLWGQRRLGRRRWIHQPDTEKAAWAVWRDEVTWLHKSYVCDSTVSYAASQ